MAAVVRTAGLGPIGVGGAESGRYLFWGPPHTPRALEDLARRSPARQQRWILAPNGALLKALGCVCGCQGASTGRPRENRGQPQGQDRDWRLHSVI